MRWNLTIWKLGDASELISKGQVCKWKQGTSCVLNGTPKAERCQIRSLMLPLDLLHILLLGLRLGFKNKSAQMINLLIIQGFCCGFPCTITHRHVPQCDRMRAVLCMFFALVKLHKQLTELFSQDPEIPFQSRAGASVPHKALGLWSDSAGAHETPAGTSSLPLVAAGAG